ncbi:MAG: methylcrotonoyl-CoA carboxylase [Chloroflexi bacterium]|nr:methylcrotonoyl-CoA carboxylase [Chloroflexota bacterium]
MIDSLLVANRGEIALRIFRTCKRLGIRTIGVYADADARALHVIEADEAYRVGPSPASQSYLNAAAILDAASRAGAQAIHPGYGFLAENADFAQAVLDAGLIWVGPPVGAMRALGDKAQAKTLAEQQAVPLLPGYHGVDQSAHTLAEHAARIGYPVLIKATAGGGGRGMRLVDIPDQFEEALQAARREASASFGDDRVLLERYVRRPRHVEVQIFGDLHGHVIHLGERECSIQRRHQKLIEESPSPGLEVDLRAQMTDAGLRLGRAAGYANAGTVEFLLDEQRSQFAFLEVNARLQVEHPITEAVTGLDLVELQLRVAAGEPLPLAQADVHFTGHAIEARVIAEDPLAGFLPSSGTVFSFAHPDDVRVDTWITNGAQVSPYYDSLLAKVIAHAPQRSAARSTLARALRAMWIDGVADNVDLLLATIEHPAFGQGDLHTGFLDEHHVIDELGSVPPPVMAAVSALDSFAGGRAYRFSRPPELTDEATAGLRGAYAGGGRLTAPMPGRVVKIAVARGERVGQNQPLMVLEAMKMEHIIEAPHPGVVTELCVQVGEQVPSGAQLLILGSADEPANARQVE